MSERCKNCYKLCKSGFWLTPQFKDERVLLFCSEKCKEDYLKRKLEQVKEEYPNYYQKLLKSKKKTFFDEVLDK